MMMRGFVYFGYLVTRGIVYEDKNQSLLTQ
jgi:hypothetical protein